MKADKRRSLGKMLSKYSPLVNIVKIIDKKQEVLFSYWNYLSESSRYIK